MTYETTAVETREWHYEDKSEWPQGEWKEEPDKVQWTDEETGLPCLIVRGPVGALCGYAGVPKSHPFFGCEYSSCPIDCPEDWCDHTPENILEAHGGITFSLACSPNKDDPERGICHVVAGDEKIWWFGFDCAHLGDCSPCLSKLRSDEGLSTPHPGEVYRSVSYVKEEARTLALQLSRISAAPVLAEGEETTE